MDSKYTIAANAANILHGEMKKNCKLLKCLTCWLFYNIHIKFDIYKTTFDTCSMVVAISLILFLQETFAGDV